MTVGDIPNKIKLSCDGTQTEFDFNFKYIQNSDIRVYLPDVGAAADNSNLLTEGIDYTLSTEDKNAGGTVIFGTPPLDTKELFIIREEPYNQTVPFKPNTNFPEQVIETGLDKLTMLCQQLREAVSRCVKVAANTTIGDILLPGPKAGSALIWNEDGTNLKNTDYNVADLAADVDSVKTSEKNAVNSAAAAAASEDQAEYWAGEAEKYVKGAGLPILFIGWSLFVNEALGLDRYLNGQLVAINDNYKTALTELKKLKATNPSLFTTEENWQAEKLLSPYGQVGKFVIADDESTLRLPAVVNVQGLFDLQNLGLRVEAGLPNITASWNRSSARNVVSSTDTLNGAFSKNTTGTNKTFGDSDSGYPGGDLTFNASLSNPIYGNSDTVQPEAIQYPFFIRLATGQETEVNIINTLENNIPYTLLESKYSEAKLNNASWLRSEGQYNAKAIYVTAYEALRVEQNAEVEEGQTVELPSGSSYTKRGLSVKLSTEDYTDYDFVLNTSDETFRLPIKSKLAGSKFAKGNGMTLGLTDGTNNGGIVGVASSNLNSIMRGDINAYGLQVGQSSEFSQMDNGKVYGITTDSSKSGIELDTEKVYLYYYVGETIQNANLINAGRIEEKLTDINSRPYITETYENGTSWYRVWSDGWCEQGGELSSVNQDRDTTITLLKAFKDINYSVLTNATGGARSNGQWTNTTTIKSRSISSFVMLTYDYTFGRIWQACGYIN